MDNEPGNDEVLSEGELVARLRAVPVGEFVPLDVSIEAYDTYPGAFHEVIVTEMTDATPRVTALMFEYATFDTPDGPAWGWLRIM